MSRHVVLCCIAIILACAAPSMGSFSPALTFVTPTTSYWASCVDYDKDGYPDLILDKYMYHNNGNGTFTNVLTLSSVSTHTVWADFDNDGIRDALILGGEGVSDRIQRVSGYSGSGVPTFGASYNIVGYDVPWANQNAAETLGPPSVITNSAAVADVNRDGKLDIYLGRSKHTDGSGNEYFGKDWLVKNTTSGSSISFLDITNDVGWTRTNQYCPDSLPSNQFRWTEGVGAADYDYNGYTDFFTATYRVKCNTFLKGGYGAAHGYTITNPSSQNDGATGILDLGNTDNGDSVHGDGAYWFDYDNDGYLDLLEVRLTHYALTGALRLWHNDHNGTFSNRSYLLPQDMGSLHQQYRGVAVGDYDNDGDLDIYVTRSYQGTTSLARNSYDSFYRGRLLKNTLVENGSAGFTDVTSAENLDNGAHADCYGTGFIDYDNDGKLDLFTMQGDIPLDDANELWRNTGSWTGHWLKVRVQPPASLSSTCNADGIGAIVEIWIDKNSNGQMDAGEILTRLQMGNNTGWFWQGPTDLHFGLGNYTPSDHTIQGRVFWPGNMDINNNPIWQTFAIPGVDRLVNTMSSDSTPPTAPGTPTHAGAYSGSTVTFNWTAASDADSGVVGYNCQIGTTPGGSDVFNGSVGNVLSKSITGGNGATFYCRVQAVDFVGNIGPWSPSSDGVTVDTIAPTGSIVINGGALYTNGTYTALTLAATDSLSGVYQMRFSNNGTTWSSAEDYSTIRYRNVPSGDGLKAEYVQYIDNAGNTSYSVGSTITLDQTAPTSGAATAPASAYFSPITVTYSGSSDATSGVKKVELWYKKGSGGVWTAASCPTQTGTSGSFTFADISGDDTYYFGVVAEDNAGNRSSTPSGSGDSSTAFAAPSPIAIAQVKSAVDAAQVNTSGVVTANLGDFFYIEAGDRSCGIRIAQTSSQVSQGMTVQVIGRVATLSTGERQISADSVTDLGSPMDIYPLGMSNKALGGGAFGGQAGIAGGNGLNNVGLMIITTGRVSNSSGISFNLDDGSGAILDAELASGLSLPANDSYVGVTGIVSCKKDVGGNIQRVIWVTDFTTY